MTLVRSPAPFSTSSLVLSSSFTPATSAPNAGKAATHRENIKTTLVPILDPRSPKGGARAARRVTLHVHRHRVHRDVGGRRFDVHRERGGIAAESLRTDAEHVHRLAELFFQPGPLGVVAARAERPGGRD